MAETPERDRVVGEWVNRPFLVLDLADLSKSQRKEGSAMMDGSAAEWTTPEDENLDLRKVTHLVTNWGDPELEGWLDRLGRHGIPTQTEDPRNDLRNFPVSAILGDMVWTLDIQYHKADLERTIEAFPEQFFELPWGDPSRATELFAEHQALPIPRPEVIIRTDQYLFALGIGTNID